MSVINEVVNMNFKMNEKEWVKKMGLLKSEYK